MAVTPEFINQVAEALDELGYSVETEQDVIDDVSELNDDVTLPGIRQTGGVMTGYVSMKLAVLYSYLQGRFAAIQSVWNSWFGTDTATGVQGEWQILKVDVQTATTNANNAASASTTATAGAERVNAGLQGFTVTITDRNGVSRSVDIGFDIYRTYASVAAMNADAANVPQGKFVVIATTDPTSEENARLYIRNASTAAESFGLLCDLDQASSAAWADWLNNMKPAIESATAAANAAAERVDTVIDTANQDHTRAESDHTRAEGDHTTAGSDHTTAGTDHTQAGSDHTRAEGDHTRAEGDHTTAGSDHTTATQDHNRAEVDHTTASTDHTTAGSDHTTALNDHTQAGSDHTASVSATNNANSKATLANNAATFAQQQGNYAKEWNDHPPYIADGTSAHPGDLNYMYIWDITTHNYAKSEYVKGADLDYSTMTPEEYERLVENVKSSILFASVQTCEDIIDELN